MNPYWTYAYEALGRTLKTEHDKQISRKMNMLIMHHVHHLHTEMEDKKPTEVPKSVPKILT